MRYTRKTNICKLIFNNKSVFSANGNSFYVKECKSIAFGQLSLWRTNLHRKKRCMYPILKKQWPKKQFIEHPLVHSIRCRASPHIHVRTITDSGIFDTLTLVLYIRRLEDANSLATYTFVDCPSIPSKSILRVLHQADDQWWMGSCFGSS